MKLRAIIRGRKVHDVGYRFSLFTRAAELGCEGFFARSQLENGDQIVTALVEGDQQQIAEFRRFVETDRLEGSEVSDLAFEDHQGLVVSVNGFLHYFTADQLSKGIPALLRIDREQDKIVEKQNGMLGLQEKMIEKLEETRSDIVGELRASRDEVKSKLDEIARRSSRRWACTENAWMNG